MAPWKHMRQRTTPAVTFTLASNSAFCCMELVRTLCQVEPPKAQNSQVMHFAPLWHLDLAQVFKR